MEIHSADAGIDTDSDSNNARGNELYIAPSPYSLPLNREGVVTIFSRRAFHVLAVSGTEFGLPQITQAPPHHLSPITHPPKTKSPLAISFRERAYFSFILLSTELPFWVMGG